MRIQTRAPDPGCRQFREFDRESLTVELEVPGHWPIVSIPRSDILGRSRFRYLRTFAALGPDLTR
jgi:hypothetical protein